MSMSALANFLEYQKALVDSVSANPNVIGLVFLGSSADHSRVDQYSDQDFFLVVKPNSGEDFRQDLSWLPNHGDIVLAPRETAHGLKVLYKSGLVLEFAVFEDAELELAAANDYLVALDKQDIAPRMAAIASKSIPRPFDAEAGFELFLSLLVIGVGRARRGEVIAADQHIKGYAVEKLIQLVRSSKPSGTDRRDSLNAFRRFEFDYPELGPQIAKQMLEPAEACANGLAQLAKTELGLNQKQLEQLGVVKSVLGWS